MLFTKRNLVIELRLVEEGEIVADYVNPTITNTGTWSLNRKK